MGTYVLARKQRDAVPVADSRRGANRGVDAGVDRGLNHAPRNATRMPALTRLPSI